MRGTVFLDAIVSCRQIPQWRSNTAATNPRSDQVISSPIEALVNFLQTSVLTSRSSSTLLLCLGIASLRPMNRQSRPSRRPSTL